MPEPTREGVAAFSPWRWAQFSGCVGHFAPRGWLIVNPMMGSPRGM